MQCMILRLPEGDLDLPPSVLLGRMEGADACREEWPCGGGGVFAGCRSRRERDERGEWRRQRPEVCWHACNADATLSQTRCQDGETALMIGAENGHVAATGCLLARGADVNARSEVGVYLDC